MTKALVAPIKAMSIAMTLQLVVVLIVATLPSLTQAAKAGRLFSTSILRCPGAKRCGLFSVTMHSGRAGTSECKVSCVFLPMLQARAKTCGGCEDEDGLVPLVPTTPQPVAPVAPSTASPVAPTAPVNPATSYNIDIQFIGDPLSDKAYFVNATKKWQSVIVGDKPSFATAGFKPKEAGCVYPTTVEDLFICCVYKFIDGDQLVVGIAGPDVNRPDGTAALGTMTFDTSDITLLKNSNSLVETILHEMGHVIGTFCSFFYVTALYSAHTRSTCGIAVVPS
jgi:hypothetical protein